MGDQVQNNTTTVMINEGMISTNQNSFAVLNNSHIISLASKMGVHSESLSFEKINVLKDLENARLKLNEHSSNLMDQGNNKEDEVFPLEDSFANYHVTGNLKILAKFLASKWCLSVRKSRSSKKKLKRKPRATKAHPFEGFINSIGDKSKVSPRFNLRDRRTIKKVYP
jgi:hypothetical protein